MPAHFEGMLQQHFDEASFFADIRPATMAQPHLTVNDLATFDIRIESNVDGLVVSGDSAWGFCASQWNESDLGGLTVMFMVALALEKFDYLEEKLGGSDSQAVARMAFSEALAWQEKSRLDEFARELVDRRSMDIAQPFYSARLRHRALDPAIAEKHRKADAQELLIPALRGVGELGHRALLPHCHQQLRSDEEEARFWAAWSAVLIGDHAAAEFLKPFVFAGSPNAYRAIYLAPRALDAENCRAWLRELAQDESTRRLALIGCGIAGDPMYVPTLIHQMRIPEYARVAGEAFSMITGVDLAYEDLDAEWPNGFEAGPNEDPADDNVELDADEDLPWPNAELIQQWWDRNGRNFRQGARYLCGEPISDANCRRVLVDGFQRQRISAALELAIMKADEPLFEWRAPGFRQQQWLGLRTSRRRVS